MKRILPHLIGYTLVAACFFWAGALTRDYLVTREARLNRARYAKFLNQPAPSLASRTVKGAPWALGEHRGKVVVIEAWATWCGPCVASLPAIKRLYERFGHRSDFALVGVSLDKEVETVEQFCKSQDVSWTQLIEPGKEFESSIARALEMKEIPFTCIIDKQGIVRVYRSASGDIERSIQRLLEEPNKAPEPTATSVTSRAAARLAPAASVAHL